MCFEDNNVTLKAAKELPVLLEILQAQVNSDMAEEKIFFTMFKVEKCWQTLRKQFRGVETFEAERIDHDALLHTFLTQKKEVAKDKPSDYPELNKLIKKLDK